MAKVKIRKLRLFAFLGGISAYAGVSVFLWYFTPMAGVSLVVAIPITMCLIIFLLMLNGAIITLWEWLTEEEYPPRQGYQP